MIELPEDQRRCECCGEVMPAVGEEVTEQIDFVPAVTKVIETVRIKYACKEHEEAGIATPALRRCRRSRSRRAWPRPGCSRRDQLPLYRQCRIFERRGIDICESTLGDWNKDVAGLLLPIVAAIKASILASAVIQSDDTGILVQDRQHQNSSRRSFLWAYLGDRAEVVFDVTPGRELEEPRQFLGDYRTTAATCRPTPTSGYDVIFATGRVVEVGCWAHARRGFFEALENDRENANLARRTSFRIPRVQCASTVPASFGLHPQKLAELTPRLQS